MRRANYPGSNIVIEKELENGSNYKRYYAYYLSEGLKIYGLLTVPFGRPPEGGWPGLVFNHGYIDPKVYRTTERYVQYADWLSSSGYVVYKIDYRGHDKSEGAPGGAYTSPGYTVDVLNALASLRRYSQVNPEKIGMWGHSMGGFLTLRAMVISRDIKVGVVWGGVVGSYSDLLYNWRRGNEHPHSSAGRRRLALGLDRWVWRPRTKPCVLGIDLCQHVRGGSFGSSPAPSWNGGPRGAIGVFPVPFFARSRQPGGWWNSIPIKMITTT